jgi:hypothetical protein
MAEKKTQRKGERLMLPIINQFNRYALNNKSLIQKALTSAVGFGAALIPQNLEELITDTVIRLSPELALMATKSIEGKTHEFNRLTQRPAPGGAMGENATTPISNSKTARDNVDLKVIRRKGKVTNFLNDTSRKYIDSASYEMENHIQAHVLDIIFYSLFGNKDANSNEFDGIDKMIATNRLNSVGVPTSLSILDNMIDKSNRKGGARHRRVFGMSPEMLSKFSQLLTNVRLNQGLSGSGLSQVEVNGGWRLNAYRDIPIIETTSTSAIDTMRPIVVGADVVSGGSLVNGNYFFRIAPMTYEGEQVACAEVPVVVNGGGSAQSITLTLSDIHKDASGAINCYSYKIYGSTTTGAEKLLKIVSAYTYDSEGSPTGYNGVGANPIVIQTMTPGADVPTAMQNDVPFEDRGSGIMDEMMYLWDLDPIQGLGKMPYTNVAGDQFNGLVTTKPLAEVDDYIQFLVKSYCALTPAFEATSCIARGVRRA